MPQLMEPLESQARSIEADRNFEAASGSFVESYVAWRRTRGGYNKVISSSARHRIMRCVLNLHYGNVTDNPDDGATFERLLALCNAHCREAEDGCGPRVLRTVISLAHRSGLLNVSQGWYDRRLKILRPTDKWIADEAEWHEAALLSFSLLAQDRYRVTARPRGAALVGRLAVMAGRSGHPLGLTLGEPDARLRTLASLDGGMATAFAVADAWKRGQRLPSHKDLGASFRISASQARKILRLAADQGLLHFDRDGKIGDASALASACRHLVAHEFALYARCLTPFEAKPDALLVAAAFAAARPVEHAR